MGLWESIIAGDILTDINNHVRPRKIGYVSGEAGMMRLLSQRVRIPDVAFISSETLARAGNPRGPVPSIAPDLAVEVLSEGNTRAEMAQKLREYVDSGTRLVWYVEPPARTVAVYHKAGEPTRVLTEADALDGEDVLPGFALAVVEIFRGVPAGDADARP